MATSPLPPPPKIIEHSATVKYIFLLGSGPRDFYFPHQTIWPFPGAFGRQQQIYCVHRLMESAGCSTCKATHQTLKRLPTQGEIGKRGQRGPAMSHFWICQEPKVPCCLSDLATLPSSASSDTHRHTYIQYTHAIIYMQIHNITSNTEIRIHIHDHPIHECSLAYKEAPTDKYIDIQMHVYMHVLVHYF